MDYGFVGVGTAETVRGESAHTGKDQKSQTGTISGDVKSFEYTGWDQGGKMEAGIEPRSFVPELTC